MKHSYVSTYLCMCNSLSALSVFYTERQCTQIGGFVLQVRTGRSLPHIILHLRVHHRSQYHIWYHCGHLLRTPRSQGNI